MEAFGQELLEWIDDFITAQETALDRTLGKWNNVMDGLPLMAHLPRTVRQRICRARSRSGGTSACGSDAGSTPRDRSEDQRDGNPLG